jgi:hypothetical protein
VKYLEYNKHRVIGSSSEAKSSSSSSSENEDQTFKQKMEKSIIKGISLSKEDRNNLLSEIRRDKAKSLFKIVNTQT